MKRFLIFLAVLMLIFSASASAAWYPRAEDYVTTGSVEAGDDLSVGDDVVLPGIAVDAAPVSYVNATYTSTMDGANNDIVLTANWASWGGTLGNSIDFTLVDPGEAAWPMEIDANTTTGAISITLTSDGSINTTATELIAAIEADDDASAIVAVALSGSDTGDGVVTALSKQDLSGGINGTAGTTGEIRYYLNDLYYLLSGSTYANALWKKWDGLATSDTALNLGAVGVTSTGTGTFADIVVSGSVDQVGDLSSLTTTEKGSVVGAINEVDADVGTNTGAIGTLTSLTTTEQGSLQGAINEVDADVGTNTGAIGTLASLTTTEQGSLQGAINEVDADVGTNTGAIGTLASLTTTEQGSLQGAINEVDAHADTNAGAITTLQANDSMIGAIASGSIQFGAAADCDSVTIGGILFNYSATPTATLGEWGPYGASGSDTAAALVAGIIGDERNDGGAYFAATANTDTVSVYQLAVGVPATPAISKTGGSDTVTIENFAGGVDPAYTDFVMFHHDVTALDVETAVLVNIPLPFAPSYYQAFITDSSGVSRPTVTDTFSVGTSPNRIILTDGGAVHVVATDIITIYAYE